MDEFELALRGLSKYFMELFQKMVEKGKSDTEVAFQAAPSIAPEPTKPTAKRNIDELTSIDKKIIDALQGNEHGLTLRDLAKKINLNWQTIVRPVNHLVDERYLDKERKLYGLPGVLKVEDRRTVIRRREKGIEYPKPKPLKLSPDQKRDLKKLVMDLLSKAKAGLTLPDMGKLLDRNWQSLKDIIRELIIEDRIQKIPETKKYIVK